MIYFIRPKVGGAIKIGTSIRLSQRIRQLQAEFGELEVLAVTDGSYDEESILHQRFAHLRHHGEWFEPGDDLLAFIIRDGRPWNGADEKSFSRFEMLIEEDERARWEAAAKADGRSLAAWIRRIANRAANAQVKRASPVVTDRLLILKRACVLGSAAKAWAEPGQGQSEKGGHAKS